MQAIIPALRQTAPLLRAASQRLVLTAHPTLFTFRHIVSIVLVICQVISIRSLLKKWIILFRNCCLALVRVEVYIDVILE